MFTPKLKPVMLAVAGVIAATSSVYAADKTIKASAVDVVSTTPLQGIGCLVIYWHGNHWNVLLFKDLYRAIHMTRGGDQKPWF